VVTNGTNPLAEESPALLQAVLGPDLSPRYQLVDAIALPIDQPALLMLASDVGPVLPVDRVGQRRALIPLPTLGRNTRDGIRLFDLPPRSGDDLAAAIGLLPSEGGGVAPYVRANNRPRAGDSMEILVGWHRSGGGLRTRVSLVDTAGQSIVERGESQRRPLDLAADQLLLTRHQVALPARAAGDYRLVAELVGPDGSVDRSSLTTISVQPR
jgi:hypothetical protein